MVVPQVTQMCDLLVMWPMTTPAAFRGNVGVNTPAIESLVANRILDIVREQCPNGEMVRPALAAPVAAIPGYAAALDGTRMTALELQTAMSALERGAHYLLVPTIEQWNQSRTDDPIGAFITPKNRIAISLRLMRLDPPAVAGSFTFRNRSRLTLNQPAARLLGDDFDRALRGLLGDPVNRAP